MSINTVHNAPLAAYMSQARSRPDSAETSAQPAIAQLALVQDSQDDKRQTLSAAVSDSGQARSDPAQELRDYMKMSYGEKIQWQWMQAHGISKEAFAQMSAEDKQQLMQQMREDLQLHTDPGQQQRHVRIDVKV